MEPFTTRRSNYTLLILLFLIVAILVTLALVKQSQELRKKAAVQTTTTLEISPATKTVNSGENFSVDVLLKTGTVNHINVVHAVLKYEPTLFQFVSLVPGPFLSGQVGSTTHDDTTGTATIEVTPATADAGSVQGDGVAAILTLKALAPVTDSPISFDSATGAAGSPGDLNLLSDAIGGTVTVLSTATPTPTPTSTPIPTPTATPGPTGTPVPSPTLTPSPSVNPNGHTSMLLAPSLNSVRSGDDFDVSLNAYTGVDMITTANIKLNYLQDYVEIKSVTIGSFLQRVLSPVVIGDVSTTVVLGDQIGSTKTGNGVLLTLRVHAKKVGVSNLVVDPASYVLAADDSNVLIQRGTSVINATSATGVTASPPIGGGGICTKTAPAAPTGLVAYAGSTYYDVDLYWNQVNGATHYGIVYGLYPGKYIYGAANVGNVASYKVRQLRAGTRYYFAVFAVNDCIAYGYSNEATVVTKAPPYTPRATPLPTPTPAANFVPIEPDIPPNQVIPFLYSQPSVEPIASPVLPTPSPSAVPGTKGIFGFVITPLWGILLIIAAIFAGLLFLKLREDR